MTAPAGLTQLIQDVLGLQKEWSSTNTPPMQERGTLIRRLLPAVLKSALAAAGSSLDVQGSDGAGGKTRVPWVRVFDPSASPRATAGWYLVYLFAADGSRVYLSLNQGTSRTIYGGSYQAKPKHEIIAATGQARSVLGPQDGWLTDIFLADAPGGPGGAYALGSVLAKNYLNGQVPGDDALVADLVAGAALLTELQAALPIAALDKSAQVGAVALDAPALTDVPAFVEWMRARYGPELVPSRVSFEADARELLNAHAGAMTLEQAQQLGALINSGTWAGAPRKNRFSPAFVGASLAKLVQPLDSFNEWTGKMWNASEEAALEALADLVADRKLRPGAGSSYPSLLMYLRDPEKYAVWIGSTKAGLAALEDASASTGSVAGDYAAFCAAIGALRKDYALAPQEVDAVLAEATRQHQAQSSAAIKVLTEDEAQGLLDAKKRLSIAAKATHLDPEVLEEWLDLLSHTGKQQLVFFGPPGTGKTFVAERLAWVLAGPEGAVRTVQFHPSFGYEDFVEGLRPVIDPQTKQLSYEVVPGVLRAFCDDVVRSTDAPCVLVIDEMNRADLASVLGELILLLEYRGRSVVLPYSKDGFSLPSNLYLIASMNTADRSLALVDYAMRRRFHAVRIAPDRQVLQRYLEARAEPAPGVLEFFDLVQARVSSEDFAPGHSFWMTPDLTSAGLSRIWRYELQPYLAELWADAPSSLSSLNDEVAQFLAENV